MCDTLCDHRGMVTMGASIARSDDFMTGVLRRHERLLFAGKPRLSYGGHYIDIVGGDAYEAFGDV